MYRLIQVGDTTIDDEIVKKAVDMVIDTITKAIPKESLCIAIINEILERTKEKIQTIPTAFFLQCPEEKKK